MPRLPTKDDYALSTPAAARRLVDVPTIRQEPDLDTGAAIKQVGAVGFKYADVLREETEKLDALKAQDALNQIQQARLDLTMGEKGAYSVKAGGVLDPSYQSGFKSRFDTTVEGIMSSLTPAQRAKLTPHAKREGLGFQTDILRHSMAQTEEYKGLVEKGQASTAVNVGIAQRGDPVAFDAEVAKLEALAMSRAQRKGLTGKDDVEKDTIIALRQEMMSPVYVGAITGLLDDRNPERARALLTQGNLAIEPGARLKLNEQITKVEEDSLTRAKAGEILRDVQAANTVPGMLAAVARGTHVAESGGALRMTGPDGKLIQGPVIASGPMKGQRAVGPFQFMEATAKGAAGKAGVPWDKELFYGTGAESFKYHETLHQAHLNKLLSMFSTRAEIYAAYNAGEGNVVKAKEKFDHVQKLISMGVNPVLPGHYNANRDGPLTFLDFLPKPGETKPYVRRAITAEATMPDIVRPSKAEIEASLAAKFPGRPDLAKAAATVVEHNLALQEDARKTEIEQAKESAYKLMAMGKAFTEVPPSLINKLPVREQDAMRDVFNKHADSTPRDSLPGLLQQINSDPNYLARISAADWEGPMRLQLSKYDHDRFTKQRAMKLGGDVKEAETLDDGSIGRVLSTRLLFLGIEPTPKKHDAAGRALVTSTRAAIDQSVLERQKQLNRRLTDAELVDHIDTMFRSQALRDKWFGEPESIPVLSMNYSDLSGDIIDTIKADFKKQGINTPTEAQILAAYKQTKLGLR